jgi:flavin-dependent dehydrogenase
MAQNDWDMETDLLVAGAGPGGMTAALVAATEGLEVIVCEKAEQAGGTGAPVSMIRPPTPQNISTA